MGKLNLKFILPVFAALSLLWACDDDDNDNHNVRVSTLEISDVTYTSAKVGAKVTGDNIVSKGICWSKNSTPTVNDFYAAYTGTEETFTMEAEGLEPGERYYVRAYARTNNRTHYGSVKNFYTVSENQPLLSLDQVNRTGTGADVIFTLSNVGQGNFTEKGIVYGTSENPTVNNATKVVSAGTETGTFTVPLTGLVDGTQYFVRAYAIVDQVVYYSNELDFRMPGAGSIPSVDTGNSVSELGWSATLSGTINDLGDMDDAEISEKGIIYGTTSNVLTNGEEIVSLDAGNNFSATIETEQGVTYYYAAYVKTQYGTGYGDVQSFTSRKIYGDFIKPRPADNSEVLPNSITPYINGRPVLADNAYSAFYKDILNVLVSYYPTLDHIAYVFRRVVDTNEPVLYISHSYEGGRATVYYKMSANSNNDITFTSLRTISGNTLTLLNNLEGEQKNIISNYLENYFTGSGTFRMGWVDGETNNVKLYPVNNPDNYISGASTAWTGTAYASDVADW